MIPLISRALGLGLASGISCFGFCLPVALPVLFGNSRTGFPPSLVNLALFLLGRLAAYLAFGVVFGVVGARLGNFTPLRTIILPIVYLLLSLSLIVYGITALDPFARLHLCHRLKPVSDSGWFLLLLGILVGITPCPPFLLGITTVIDLGGIKNGVLFFLFFFLATSLVFLPLTLAGFVNRYQEVRSASRILAVITGAYFLLLGLRLIKALTFT